MNGKFPVYLWKKTGPTGYWTPEITEFSPAKGMATPAALQLLLPVTPFHHQSLGPMRGKVTRQPVKHTASPDVGLVAVFGGMHMSRGSVRHRIRDIAAGVAAASYACHLPGSSAGAELGCGGDFQTLYFKKRIQVTPRALCVHVSVPWMHFKTRHAPYWDWLILLPLISDWWETTALSSSGQKFLGQSEPARGSLAEVGKSPLLFSLDLAGGQCRIYKGNVVSWNWRLCLHYLI